MKAGKNSHRYIYKTQGVCPPEIHFQIEEGMLQEVRFLGGGCPGNAELVSRLLRGKPLTQVLEEVKGIPCRNGTSCPDQLASALGMVMAGRLVPAGSFRIREEEIPRKRIGLIGELGGKIDLLDSILAQMAEEDVEAIYCLGNLTGRSEENKALLKRVRERSVVVLLGERDWQYARIGEGEGSPPRGRGLRDDLLRLPQVLSFRLGDRKGVAFYGGYLQGLPGFSDFEPFALEINLVCSLTDYFQDESVFPALNAMSSQMNAGIVVFSGSGKWGHWRSGGVDFISLGPAEGESGPTWGFLDEIEGFSICTANRGGNPMQKVLVDVLLTDFNQ
jgi:uncharacterized protein (TIGR03905 family)